MGRREISGQAHCKDVPEFAVLHGARMKLCSEKGGECIAAIWTRVGNGVVINANHVVRQGYEIITLRLIAAADLGGGQDTIGQGGMGVQVAAVKAAGRGKGR